MLSQERIEAYRRMSPEERWREVEQLMTLAWRSLLQLPADERQRRLDLDRQWHDEGDRLVLEHLRRLG